MPLAAGRLSLHALAAADTSMNPGAHTFKAPDSLPGSARFRLLPRVLSTNLSAIN